MLGGATTAGSASGRSGVVTAIAPMTSPSCSTTTTVSPRRKRSVTSSVIDSGSRDSTNLLTWISRPSSVPVTPIPGKERTWVARISDLRRGHDGKGDRVLAFRLHRRR